MAQDPGADESARSTRPDPPSDTDGYRRVFEASPHPMWVYERDTLRFLAVNDAAVARYGYSREEFLARTIRDIRSADEVEPLERHVRALGEGLERAGIWHHRLKSGERIEVEVTGHPLEFAGRRARLVMAVDVTEARRTHETLRWLQRAVEQTDAAILLTDPEGVITYVNPAFERLYGYTLQGAVGQTPRLLKSGEMSADHYASLWHTLLAGRNYRGTHINRARDGTLVVVEASVTPLRGAADEAVGFVSIHHDITDRRRLEEKRELLEAQLAHAQRFEALGTLAAGMAHDFNNLLGVVLGHAALLATAPGDPERVSRAAAALRLAGERGSSLVQRVLTFARRTDARFEVTDAWQLASEVERLLKDILPRSIAFELAADPGGALVWADRGQLQQVLLNLCLNARDAMPEGGCIRVSTRALTLPGHRRARPRELYVRICVEDDGIGMSEDIRARVLEPFFTTKAKGTGLGLATVHRIVREYDGRLEVYSAPGHGSTFEVLLPAASDRNCATGRGLVVRSAET